MTQKIQKSLAIKGGIGGEDNNSVNASLRP